jgi:hypothetical protein
MTAFLNDKDFAATEDESIQHHLLNTERHVNRLEDRQKYDTPRLRTFLCKKDTSSITSQQLRRPLSFKIQERYRDLHYNSDWRYSLSSHFQSRSVRIRSMVLD